EDFGSGFRHRKSGCCGSSSAMVMLRTVPGWGTVGELELAFQLGQQVLAVLSDHQLHQQSGSPERCPPTLQTLTVHTLVVSTQACRYVAPKWSLVGADPMGRHYG